MEPPNQRRDNVAVFRMVVIAGAVQIGWHNAAVVHAVACAVLAVVAFAEFDAGDFGNRIGFVGGLEHAGQQGVFAHGLFCQAGIDAAGAQKKQFFHTIA